MYKLCLSVLCNMPTARDARPRTNVRLMVREKHNRSCAIPKQKFLNEKGKNIYDKHIITKLRPSLHPHSLTRVVSCLCPTDFYTEWSTYRTLLFTPLMALRHCGEWASTSVVISLDYIYIIPQNLWFVKRFLKKICNFFSTL